MHDMYFQLALLFLIGFYNEKSDFICNGSSISVFLRNGNRELEKIAPYPKAEKGMTRHVIQLPTKPNEDNLQVELVIGKTIKADCNRQWFMGDLEEKP